MGIDVTGQGVKFLLEIDGSQGLKAMRQFQSGMQSMVQGVETVIAQSQQGFSRMIDGMEKIFREAEKNPGLIFPIGGSTKSTDTIRKMRAEMEKVRQESDKGFKAMQQGMAEVTNASGTMTSALGKSKGSADDLGESLDHLAMFGPKLRALAGQLGVSIGIGAIVAKSVELSNSLETMAAKLQDSTQNSRALKEELNRTSEASNGFSSNIVGMMGQLVQLGVTSSSTRERIMTDVEKFSNIFKTAREPMVAYFAEMTTRGMMSQEQIGKVSAGLTQLQNAKYGAGTAEQDIDAMRRSYDAQQLIDRQRASTGMSLEKRQELMQYGQLQMAGLGRFERQKGLPEGLQNVFTQIPSMLGTTEGQRFIGSVGKLSGEDPKKFLGDIQKTGRFDKIGKALEEAAEKVPDKLTSILPPEFVSQLTGGVLTDARQLVAALKQAKEMGMGLGDAMKMIADDTAKAYHEQKALNDRWDDFKKTLGGKWNEFGSAWDRILTKLTIVMEGPLSSMLDIMNAITKKVEAVVDWLNKWKTGLAFVQGIMKAIGEAFLFAGAIGIVRLLIASVMGLGTAFMFLMNPIKGVTGLVTNLLEKFALLKAAKGVIGAVAEGAAAGAATGAATGASAATGAAAAAKPVASPMETATNAASSATTASSAATEATAAAGGATTVSSAATEATAAARGATIATTTDMDWQREIDEFRRAGLSEQAGKLETALKDAAPYRMSRELGEAAKTATGQAAVRGAEGISEAATASVGQSVAKGWTGYSKAAEAANAMEKGGPVVKMLGSAGMGAAKIIGKVSTPLNLAAAGMFGMGEREVGLQETGSEHVANARAIGGAAGFYGGGLAGAAGGAAAAAPLAAAAGLAFPPAAPITVPAIEALGAVTGAAIGAPAVGHAAAVASQWFGSFFDSHDPKEVGKDIGKGIEDGVKNAANATKAAAAALDHKIQGIGMAVGDSLNKTNEALAKTMAKSDDEFTIDKQGYSKSERSLLDRGDQAGDPAMMAAAKDYRELREAGMKAVQGQIDKGKDPHKLSMISAAWKDDQGGDHSTRLTKAAIEESLRYLKQQQGIPSAIDNAVAEKPKSWGDSISDFLHLRKDAKPLEKTAKPALAETQEGPMAQAAPPAAAAPDSSNADQAIADIFSGKKALKVEAAQDEVVRAINVMREQIVNEFKRARGATSSDGGFLGGLADSFRNRGF